MLDSNHNKPSDAPAASRLRHVLGIAAITLAILLSFASCTLLLLIPSASIDVETVYGGF